MLAKTVKEMLASVPDDAEIIISIDKDGDIISSKDLILSLDSKTKAYHIESCNGYDVE